jgi:hypothetical protein
VLGGQVEERQQFVLVVGDLWDGLGVPAAWRDPRLDPARLQSLFEGLMADVAGRFARVEPCRRARPFVPGLLEDLPGKNCGTIAEQAGDASPAGMHHLLNGRFGEAARTAVPGQGRGRR